MLLQAPLTQEHIDYLRKRGFLHPDESVRSSGKAGEGNMNVTLSVATDKRTIILKQSRPFVAKYPQVPAPPERTGIEYRYYQCLASQKVLARYSPRIIAFDPDSWLLAMEFVEQGADHLEIYQRPDQFTEALAEDLLRYLKGLHQLEVQAFPENGAMRALNHQHIFVLPFQEENGFDLDGVQPGLQQLSRMIKTNPRLVARVMKSGERYLSPGRQLIHGDFYPGSWLSSPGGLKIIDTEFAFLGDPEFDLAVMLAHLHLARVPEDRLKSLRESYPLDEALLATFTGIEMLRRLFGLAQLPLDLSLEEKETLAHQAIQLILHEAF